MIRILIENIFIFLLPSILYVAYIAFIKRDWPGLGHVIRDAPLLKLFVIGAVLMLGALAAFSTKTGHDPREPYTPQTYSDGKLSPGGGSKP